jgi:thiosulfate dehydrogenase (quinone) large subunit
MNLPSSRAYGSWLALVRFLTGVMWLIHAVPKFLHPERFLPPNGAFSTYLQHGITSTVGPYRDFMVTVVSPNAALVAELVRVAELLVGISLVLGLFTRLGALFGIVLPLNYMAARAAIATVSGWGTLDAAMLLLSAISFVLPTGRVAGCDALFARRRRPAAIIPEVVPERPLEGPTAPS